jgi:hypothetical protein
MRAGRVTAWPGPRIPRGRGVFGLFLRRLSCAVLDRHDDVRLVPTEPLDIEVFDELGQRGLPRLLAMVVHAAELLRVQPEFARHLHLGMSELVSVAGVDPGLQSGR